MHFYFSIKFYAFVVNSLFIFEDGWKRANVFLLIYAGTFFKLLKGVAKLPNIIKYEFKE